MSLERRTFLKAGLGGLMAGAMPATVHAFRLPNVTPGNVLVAVKCLGAYDGVSVHIPHGQSLYPQVRRGTAYSPAVDNLLGDDGTYAWHPRLSLFSDKYAAGKLALFHKVGYPNENLSHFTSQDIWAAGLRDPAEHSSGWIGRLAAVDFTTYGCPPWGPTSAVGMGTSSLLEFVPVDPSLVAPALVMDDVDSFRIPEGNFSFDNPIRALAGEYSETLTASQKAIVQSFRAGNLGAYALAEAVQVETAGYTPVGSYPASGLGAALRDVARMIYADKNVHPSSNVIRPNVYLVVTGGFDTHNDQKARLDSVWGGVDDALVAFDADLTSLGVQDTTLQMLYTEFGRRNTDTGTTAAAGTDHGHGNLMMAWGGSVVGGDYGTRVTDADLALTNLPVEVDFREPFRGALRHFFGLGLQDVNLVFPGSSSPLDNPPQGEPLFDYFV